MTRLRMTLLYGLALTASLAVTGVALDGGQPAAGKQPGETYLAYRAAMLKAKSIEAMTPWLAREARAQVDEMPEEERPMMFEFLQEMSGAITNVKVVGEKVDGDTALVQVEGTNQTQAQVTGKIEMAREDGAWRVVRENWGSEM
jgi:hypothetical protein